MTDRQSPNAGNPFSPGMNSRTATLKVRRSPFSWLFVPGESQAEPLIQTRAARPWNVDLRSRASYRV